MGHVPRAGECPGGSIASACAVPVQMWPALFLSMRMCAVRPRRRCGSYSESGPHQLCRQGSAFQRRSLTLSARKRAKASLVSCCILRHAPSGVLTPFQKRAAWVWLPMHEAVWHICTKTGLAPTTSAAGTGLTPPTSAEGRRAVRPSREVLDDRKLLRLLLPELGGLGLSEFRLHAAIRCNRQYIDEWRMNSHRADTSHWLGGCCLHRRAIRRAAGHSWPRTVGKEGG